MTPRPPRRNPTPESRQSSADASALSPVDVPAPRLSTGRLAYSVDEAASLTGLSRDLLYDQMRCGNLDYIKIGRRRLITRQHLEQFLQIAPKPQPPLAAQESARRRPKHAVSPGGKDMPLA
jgi:excisionase family DNA binding protein